MDNSPGIKLFNDESPEVAMPSVNIYKEDAFVADQLKDAIDGAVVQKVLLPSHNQLADKNYVMDFSNVGTITVFQKEALKGLLYRRKNKILKEEMEKSTEESDEPVLVALYMYKKGKDITELGKGEMYFLEKAIPLLKKYVFEDEIQVYKDYDPSRQVAEVISEETVSFRLNL